MFCRAATQHLCSLTPSFPLDLSEMEIKKWGQAASWEVPGYYFLSIGGNNSTNCLAPMAVRGGTALGRCARSCAGLESLVSVCFFATIITSTFFFLILENWHHLHLLHQCQYLHHHTIIKTLINSSAMFGNQSRLYYEEHKNSSKQEPHVGNDKKWALVRSYKAITDR